MTSISALTLQLLLMNHGQYGSRSLDGAARTRPASLQTIPPICSSQSVVWNEVVCLYTAPHCSCQSADSSDTVMPRSHVMHVLSTCTNFYRLSDAVYMHSVSATKLSSRRHVSTCIRIQVARPGYLHAATSCIWCKRGLTVIAPVMLP